MPSDTTTKDQASYTAHDWEKDLQRLTRRAAIERLAPENPSIQATINAVRKFEKENDTEGVIHALTTEVVNVDPKMAALAAKISESVLLKFPDVKAIVLMSSAVHGGQKMRNITAGGQAGKDFDWGIITAQEWVDYKPRAVIVDYVRDCLKESKIEFNLSQDYSSCWYLNGKNFFATHLNDIEGARQTMGKNLGGINDISSIILYFHPSFPPEINEANREHILNALKEIDQEDQAKWRHIVQALLQYWTRIHEIGPQHLGPRVAKRLPTDKEFSRQERIAEKSSRVMSEPFKKMLESTGEEK